MSAPGALAQDKIDWSQYPDDELTPRLNTLTSEGRFDEVVLMLEEVLEEEPERAWLYQPLIKSYAYLGLFERAEQRTRDLYFQTDHPILSLDALRGSGHCRFALIYSMQAEGDRALAHVDSMQVLSDPKRLSMCASRFSARWGEYTRAAEQFEQILNEGSRSDQNIIIPWAIHVHRALGNEERAGELMAEADERVEALDEAFMANSADETTYDLLGQYYMLKGNPKQAIASVRRAYEMGGLWYYNWWKTINPIFQPLHDRPAFQQLMAEMEAEIKPMRARVVNQLKL